jgi:hypothetical protein
MLEMREVTPPEVRDYSLCQLIKSVYQFQLNIPEIQRG